MMRRPSAHLFPALLLLLSAGCASSRVRATTVPERVAAFAGLQRLDDVSALRFTFHARLGDREIARGWEWEPATNRVTATPADGGPSVTFVRGQVEGADEATRRADAGFVNDSYWLLFPYHVVHDELSSTEIRPDAPLPIGEGTAQELVVRYPTTGGYTPGDVYELYLGPDGRIVQWRYLAGGRTDRTRATRWTDYRRVGPLTLSLDRPGPDDGFRVWFTDVAVKVPGSSHWLEPGAAR